MSSTIMEQYDRNRMGGFIMERIASRFNVSLGEAVGIYLSHPFIEERVNHDDYDDVMDVAYPSKIVEEMQR